MTRKTVRLRLAAVATVAALGLSACGQARPDAHGAAEALRLPTTTRLEDTLRERDRSVTTIFDATVECDDECQAWGGPWAVHVTAWRDEADAQRADTGNDSRRRRSGRIVATCSPHLPAASCDAYLARLP